MDDTESNNKGISDLGPLIQNTLLDFLNHQVHDINSVNSLSANIPHVGAATEIISLSGWV